MDEDIATTVLGETLTTSAGEAGTPSRLQRMKRLQSVSCGPRPRGASFHCGPWRMT